MDSSSSSSSSSLSSLKPTVDVKVLIRKLIDLHKEHRFEKIKYVVEKYYQKDGIVRWDIAESNKVITNGEDFWKTSNASTTSLKIRNNMFAKCSVAMMCSEFSYLFCKSVEEATKIGLDVTLNGSSISLDSWIVRSVHPWDATVNPILQYKKTMNMLEVSPPSSLITMYGGYDDVQNSKKASISHQYVIIEVCHVEDIRSKSKPKPTRIEDDEKNVKNDRCRSKYLVDFSAAQLNVFDCDEKGYYYSLIELNPGLLTVRTNKKTKKRVYNESKVENRYEGPEGIEMGIESFLSIVEFTKINWKRTNKGYLIKKFDDEIKNIQRGLLKFLNIVKKNDQNRNVKK